MAKYAPADGEGRKPYVVAVRDWGRESEELVWAGDAAGARREAVDGTVPWRYALSTRRAIPGDVERLGGQ